ncbi:MAG: RidA family protein [Gemmatimonadales bacterium]|nr:MAG: RidA family protein [Gemmatimonadales bacterium]
MRRSPLATSGRHTALRAAVDVLFATLLALTLAAVALAAVPAASQTLDAEARLAEMGIELPVPDENRSRSFDRVVQTGNLVFTSGHGACGNPDVPGRGKVPSAVSVEDAQLAARQTIICILGSLKGYLGDLNRITRVVKVLGMVNSEPDFTGQSQVMNGASLFLHEVFGERGHHARSAVGMASLPVNFTVEIEIVLEIDGG